MRVAQPLAAAQQSETPPEYRSPANPFGGKDKELPLLWLLVS